ncbi:uncharacterized [Tachysurus ichikawai]
MYVVLKQRPLEKWKTSVDPVTFNLPAEDKIQLQSQRCGGRPDGETAGSGFPAGENMHARFKTLKQAEILRRSLSSPGSE